MSFNRVVECSVAGITIKDLKITFEVNKSTSKSANTCKIQIYNLRDETTKKIEDADTNLILKAGYEDEGGAKNIFFGAVLSTFDKMDGSDRILEIEALDGIKEIKNKTFSKSYKPGTKIKRIVDDLTAVIGLPVRNIKTLPDLSYVNAYGFAGFALNGLSNVLGYAKRFYTIQNNELIILSGNETFKQTGITLSDKTGLLGTPIAIKDSSKDNADTTPQRWGFKCLLYPDLIPGGLIKLDSKKVKGSFSIESVILKGSNFDDEFNAICEVKVL
jgi:hypothetical protein